MLEIDPQPLKRRARFLEPYFRMEAQWKENEICKFFIPAFALCIWGEFSNDAFQEDWDDRQRLLEIDRKIEEQAAMEKEDAMPFVLKMP